MWINKSAGWLEFGFDQKDWTLVDKWGKKISLIFISELKDEIPVDGRDYDNITHVWSIHEQYWTQFYDLKRKYFEDENQEDLFG